MGELVFPRKEQTHLVIQYQMVILKTSNIIQLEQIVIMYLGICSYIHMYVTTFNEKGGHEFERELGGYTGGFGERKKKKEIM